MIHEDPAHALIANGASPPDPVNMFEAAIAEVAELTLALTSATTKLAFADGARIRGELERNLSRAQALAEHLADNSARGEALRQLGEMQGIAIQALMIAPAPSLAAIEAAHAGDPTALRQEELAWLAARLASGSSPSVPRRKRRKTRPDSPKAMHNTPGTARDVGDMTSEPTPAPSPPIKAGKQ